ncbi:MAG TPA: ComF family protein [Alphaproteobacteria bacterium]
MGTNYLTVHGYHLWQRLIDLILPPRCPVTGELVSISGTLSANYWQTLNFIQNPQCACCGLPFATQEETGTLCGPCISDPPPFKIARSALYYDDASSPLILKFKHADRTLLAPLLAQWLQHCAPVDIRDADYIIPVPLHRWRLLKRRYNQAAELARSLSIKTSIPWLPHTLQRKRATESQGHKSATERHDNVRNAFRIPDTAKAKLKGKKIVIVDDVYTTGATLKACCKTLHKAGAKEIIVLTLSRVARKQ